VPVIPCYIKGAPYGGSAFSSFWMTAKTDVWVGEPIDLSPYYDQANNRSVQEDLTRRFLTEIARLAGHDNYEPQIAGRHWKTPVT
jgi:1-acyl-sn-glycerol-3-phosphate acyltransferase